MAADSCDLLLRAAELLDHSKSQAAAHSHPAPPAPAPTSHSFPFPAMMLMSAPPLDPKTLAALTAGMPGAPFTFAADAAVPDISSLTPARESSPGAEGEDEDEQEHDPDQEDEDGDSSMDFGMDGSDPRSKRSPRGLAYLKASRFLPRDSIAHNSVEKRRRAYLAACYDGLKCSIPALAGTRASNVKVLRAGASLIKSLESEDRRIAAEKKRLIAQRDQLIQMNNQLASQLVHRRHERAVPSLGAAAGVGAAPGVYGGFVAPAAMYAAHAAAAMPAPGPAPSASLRTRERRPSESREVALSLMMLAEWARS